jgi:hypothetical protein
VEERGWAYRRRQPEGTVLYEAVKDNLATLLEEASEVGRGLPRYVERDFARYRRAGWGRVVHPVLRLRLAGDSSSHEVPRRLRSRRQTAAISGPQAEEASARSEAAARKERMKERTPRVAHLAPARGPPQSAGC